MKKFLAILFPFLLVGTAYAYLTPITSEGISAVQGTSPISVSTTSGVATVSTTGVVSVTGTSPISVSTVSGVATVSSTALSAPTVNTISSNATLACNSKNFIVTSSIAISLQLPNPATCKGSIVIKDTSGNAQTNNISVLQYSGEEIEGYAGTKIFQSNYGSWTLDSDLTNWWMD
jgi:hypothetical protein